MPERAISLQRQPSHWNLHIQACNPVWGHTEERQECQQMSKRLRSCDSWRGYESAWALKAQSRGVGAQRRLRCFWAGNLAVGGISTFRDYGKSGRFSKSTRETLLSPPTASSLRTIIILPDNACINLRYSEEPELFQSTYLMCFQKLW